MPDPIDWGFALPYYLAAFFAAYLIGSIPFGLLLTRAAGLGDIRKTGSGNIGATNVLRTGNKGIALATLLADIAKGFLPAWLAWTYFGPDLEAIAGIGAVFGHIFPVWLKFRGGKGVATTGGVLFAFSWPVALICAGVWILTALISRYSSLSALLAFVAAPIGMHFLSTPQHMEICVLLGAIGWWAHRDNLARLIAGEESKIGQKSKAAASTDRADPPTPGSASPS